MIAVLVGEIAYNLRSALDYLVYALAALDSGKLQEGTQFPMEDTPERFEAKRGRYLRGLSLVHIERLRSLQPFAGCSWTRTLRVISNPDKHRQLTGLEEVAIQKEVAVRLAPDETSMTWVYRIQTNDVVFDFDDRTSVEDVLQAISEHVSSLLQEFEREFK